MAGDTFSTKFKERAGVVTSDPPLGAPRRTAFLPEIQALRALAVTAVVVYHLWPQVLPAGFTGVDVFFVISGFLITSHMISERERTGRFRLVAFFARRVRRILPAATTVILVTGLVSVLVLPELRWADLTRHGTASLVYLQNWVLAADAVDYLTEGSGASPFRHFWSLSVEEQFYIVWPLLFLLVSAGAWSHRRRRAAVVLILGVLSAASLWVSVSMTSAGDPTAYFVSQSRFWELGMGGLLAAAARPTLRPRVAAVVGTSGTAVIVAGMFLVSAGSFPGVAALVPTTGAVLVIWSARSTQSTYLRTMASAAPVQWLGGISYSLYLWHWPLLVWAPYVVPGAPRLIQDTGVLAASLVLATLSRRLVETPFQRTVAPKAPPGAVVAFALVTTLVSVAVLQVPAAAAGRRADERDTATAAMIADPPPGLGAGSVSEGSYSAFVAGYPVVLPAPQDARSELPEGADGRCKSAMDSATTPRCTFGDDAETTIALVGDSHMEQYLPAFQVIADQHDVRVLTYFHSSCPFSQAQRASDAERDGACLKANDETLASLLAEDVDLVVTSNRTQVAFVDSAEVPGPVEGFVRAWDSLRSAGLPVVVLADNPLMLPDDATSECVLEHLDGPEACERSRAEAMPTDHQIAAAHLADVDLVDTAPWFCTSDTCPAVVGSVLVYRDEQHLTPAYTRTLVPRLWDSVSPYVTG
ncbi:acyltransferase family protein [Sanguibacter sp. 4.1]|uniref:Acyltransferase family protein n=1 Tax=Sanguibacter biliveldensis TaxID=3030830 RepID=A0AAF0Z5L2_9MICO|nr:acyltransferase family protein [Sanguibacter sp. 4.1]WPF82464.1 acyltransferase family protein [Sanguibacter sp. 4.1]